MHKRIKTLQRWFACFADWSAEISPALRHTLSTGDVTRFG